LKLEIISNKLPLTTSFEHTLIYDRQNNVNFVLIYRSSSLSVSQFLPEFDEFLAVVDLLPGRIALLGDFNIHHDQPSKSEVKRAITIMDSLNFTQIVHGPTHRDGHTLDWIVTKENDSIIVPHTITKLNVSDHFYIDCTLNLHKTHDIKTTFISRNYRSINHEAFDKDLAAKFDNILTMGLTDFDSLVKCYNQACIEVLDAHAPSTVRVRTIRRKPLWFNEAVEDARRERRRCERKFRKSHSEGDQEAYFAAQKTVSSAIYSAKTEFYNDRLANCNSKEVFKTVNELLNKNKRILPDCASTTDLANQFSDFFTSKINKIRDQVDNVVLGDTLSPNAACNHNNVPCLLFSLYLLTIS